MPGAVYEVAAANLSHRDVGRGCSARPSRELAVRATRPLAPATKARVACHCGLTAYLTREPLRAGAVNVFRRTLLRNVKSPLSYYVLWSPVDSMGFA